MYIIHIYIYIYIYIHMYVCIYIYIYICNPNAVALILIRAHVSMYILLHFIHVGYIYIYICHSTFLRIPMPHTPTSFRLHWDRDWGLCPRAWLARARTMRPRRDGGAPGCSGEIAMVRYYLPKVCISFGITVKNQNQQLIKVIVCMSLILNCSDFNYHHLWCFYPLSFKYYPLVNIQKLWEITMLNG